MYVIRLLPFLLPVCSVDFMANLLVSCLFGWYHGYPSCYLSVQLTSWLTLFPVCLGGIMATLLVSCLFGWYHGYPCYLSVRLASWLPFLLPICSVVSWLPFLLPVCSVDIMATLLVTCLFGWLHGYPSCYLYFWVVSWLPILLPDCSVDIMATLLVTCLFG